MSPLALLLAAASISMASGISLPHWATHTIGQLQPTIQVDANNSRLKLRRGVKNGYFTVRLTVMGGVGGGRSAQ